MKVGYHVGYWGAGPPENAAAKIVEAEKMGVSSIWTAEAYGSDAFTPLAWWGAATETMLLGTDIVQMSARTPTATAMAAMTLDHLSGGRFVLGLGASGPQVVEGWYGQPYPKPLARTREYIEIVRKIVARERSEYDGTHYPLPYPGGTGLGKALKSTIHPLRTEIPILLAAEGPKNVALAAEIADGWLPFLFTPTADDYYRKNLAEGFARRAPERSPEADFEIAAAVPVVIEDDVERAADQVRPFLALYIGGMGAKEVNFHAAVVARAGWEKECAEIQDLFLAGKKVEAVAAVSTRMVEDFALVGPKEKVRDELARWQETVIGTMLVRDEGDLSTLRTVLEFVS